MNHVFELYLNKEVISKEDFLALFTAISGYIGNMKKVRFHIVLKGNHVRYYIQSSHDLSVISSNVPFCILKPVEAEKVATPNNPGKEKFVSFVAGGTLLNLQEKIAIKRGRKLEHFVCDVRRITSTKSHVGMQLYFVDAGGNWTVSKKITNKFPAHLFAFDFTTASSFMKSEVPKYLSIGKILHMVTPENINALLEVDTFPYFPRNYYLPLPVYEFDKHSMIVGASGSGKSKFIELFIDRLNRLPSKHDYRAIVIDPHANLADDLRNIDGAKIIDFNSESTELFAGAEADITAATELTTTLMKSLMGDSFNPRVERVLRFSLFVLFTAQVMSLGNMKRLLTELEYRQQLLDHVAGHIPHNISQFFATDFNEIRTAFYNEGLLPIIAIIDELELQPALLEENGISLQKTINENFLTVFSLNKVSMGEKVVKTIAGLLIQQLFLLAQSRAVNERIILFIDEVSVVQSPALASILSEARKFNLFVVLTQQYFSQVDKSLQDAIFANVYNYYCFRVSEEDAGLLVGNLPMELPIEMIQQAQLHGVKEETLKIRMITDLHPRECIVRVSSSGLLLPCFKARTLDVGSNHIKTFQDKDFVPKQYTAKQPAVEKFQERKRQSVSPQLSVSSPEPIANSADPPLQKSSPPSSGLIGVEVVPITERGPITLDEMLKAQSTKAIEEVT